MRLRLEDNSPCCGRKKLKVVRQLSDAPVIIYNPSNGDAIELSGKKERQQKRSIKKAAKVAKKATKAARRVKKAESKTARKAGTQDRRTDRVVQKGQRKSAKRKLKVVKKENKVARKEGRGNIIRAKQEGRLQKVQAQNEVDLDNIRQGAYQGDFDQDESDVMPDAFYNEEYGGDSMVEPDMYYDEDEVEEIDSEYPEEGEEFEGEEEFADYELMDEELSGPLISGAVALIKKASSAIQNKADKLKSTKVGKAATGAVNLNKQNQDLKSRLAAAEKEIDSLKTQRLIFGGSGFVGGAIAGYMFKSK